MSGDLPPDRGHIETERPHHHPTPIDRMGEDEMVRFLVSDQARAIEAVGNATAMYATSSELNLTR